MNLVQANREVDKLLKDGVKVSFQNDDGDEIDETVRIIDWNNPGNNDFFLASQLRAIRQCSKLELADDFGSLSGTQRSPDIQVDIF
jgi:type I site-specific restriction-modification system R (restriction) subunit